jgi:ATP-dependent DNA ligase
VDGADVERRPYSERKDLLRKLLDGTDGTVEYVPFETDLLKAWNRALARDREGLIAKNPVSPYEHERSYNWLKVKNWRFRACDIAGFTAGENARSPFFGSLVLAKDGEYVGCAGSGFDEWELRKFKDIFTDSQTAEKPFSYSQVGEPYFKFEPPYKFSLADMVKVRAQQPHIQVLPPPEVPSTPSFLRDYVAAKKKQQK